MPCSRLGKRRLYTAYGDAFERAQGKRFHREIKIRPDHFPGCQFKTAVFLFGRPIPDEFDIGLQIGSRVGVGRVIAD